MKKINQSKFKDYMPVKFYLNNIREMIDVFEGADIKYELQTDRFIWVYRKAIDVAWRQTR